MTLMASDYDWSLIWESRGVLATATLMALKVASVALLLSVVIGLLFAVWRLAPARFSWPAALYINIFRGVPALVSVIWVYFGLGIVLDVRLSVFEASVIALVLLYSAFLAEIFRAALLAIPKGQQEAGLALGLTRWQTFAGVMLPQAAKIAMPNIGSMLIGMIKDTSTFVVIGLAEVVYVSQSIVATTYQPFVLYTAAAAIYVVLAFVIDYIFRLVEKSMGAGAEGPLIKALTTRRRRRLEALATGHMSSAPLPVTRRS